MGEIFSDCTTYNSTLSSGMKELIIDTPTSADTDDTIDVTLKDFGITTLKTIFGVKQATDGSIVATEAPTTSVSSGVLTITIGGSAVNNTRRIYTIRGI